MNITFEQVSYWYAKGTPFEKHALDNITISIPSGQFVALMGQTGSGKTTFAQLINGLLRPTQGQIQVGIHTISHKKKDLRVLRTNIGYAFQYPEHQLFEETVEKDIAFSLRQFQLPEEMIPSRVKRAMELVGLSYEDIKERSPFQLSGGQMRRVALAGVLAIRPKVLILDEPTAGLDPIGRVELLQLVRRLHQEEDMTIIYITHHLEEALEYAERLLVMKYGQLFLDITPAKVPSNIENLEEAGILSTPLLRCIHAINQKAASKIPDDVIQEEQLIPYLVPLWKGEK